MKKALFALAVVAMLGSRGAAQTTKYWDINGATAGAGGATPAGAWDTATTDNWTTDSTGASAATTWTAGDNAVFAAGTDATGAYTVTVSGTQTANSITVEEGTITQGTGTVTFGATNGVFNIANGATWNNAGAGTGTIAGTAGITKTGSGTLLLGGANTFSSAGAQLTVSAGVADFTADLGLGAAPGATKANAVVINGGTLRMTNNTSQTLNINRGIQIGSSGGTIEVVSTSISGLQTANAANNLNGSGTLTKTGAGRLTITPSTTTFTGKYNVLAGAINFASDARLGPVPGSAVADYFTLNGANAGLRFSVTTAQTLNANRGITLGAGGGTLIEPGPGVMTYNGIIAGTSGGALRIFWNDNVDGTGNGGGAAGGIVVLGGVNTYNGETIIGAGATLRPSIVAAVPTTTTLNMGGAAAFYDMSTNSIDSTVQAVKGIGGTVQIGTRTLTVSDGLGLSYSSVFTASAGGKIIKNGAGSWTLSGGSNGFNGEFIMNAGTLGIGASNIFGNGADGTDASIFTYNGGVLSNNGSGGRTVPAGVSVNLNANVTADDSLFSGPGQILFNGAATINASRTITVNGTANLAFANIAESSAGLTLTKEGNGLLVMTANNSSYTGDTTVNNGTLRFTNAAAGTYAGSFFVNGGANTGRLEVDADGVIGSGSNTINLAGGILSTSASRTASFDTQVSVTADSAISTTSAAANANFDFGNNTPFTFANSGLTLTIRNDGGDGSGDRLNVRLFGAGFNIANPIDLVTGSAGSLSTLASFNTSGEQTFSGVISGTGNFNRSASTSGTGATTVFTNTGNSYTGTTTINDGTLKLGASGVIPDGSAVSLGNVSSALLDLDGNNETIASLAGGGASGGNVSLGAGTLTLGNASNTSYGGAISGAGGLVKQGNGTLTLTNASTYGGGTIINGGAVYANNTTGSATGTGAVDVNAGGTLGGTGAVSGAVSVNAGGTLSPGTSIESLDVGALTFDDTGTNPTFVYEIDSSLVTADLVNSTSLTLNGETTLAFSDLAGSPVNIAGTKFTLIAYDGTLSGLGTFAGLNQGDYITGVGANDWQINYADANPGVNGGVGTVFVTIVAAVPEASSFLFGGLACVAVGIGAVVARRRRVRTA